MIQSGKFDSSNMDIKKLGNSILIFTIKRLIEIFGFVIFCFGILLLISLVSYSPTDPNFIFPENTEIKNILGFQGSYVSDFFFQSIGMVAYLISVTYIFTGFNIIRRKEIFLLIENTFFIILYSLVGSLFFSFYFTNSFTFYINGNGGFIGNYLNSQTINNAINSFENVLFYFFIILIITLFLISINFNIKNFFQSIKKLIKFFLKKEEKNYTKESEIINEYIPQDEIKNLIQEDLPFIKAETNTSSNKIKFLLPSSKL